MQPLALPVKFCLADGSRISDPDCLYVRRCGGGCAYTPRHARHAIVRGSLAGVRNCAPVYPRFATRCSGAFAMPLIIPPFSQYQAPLFPLRGLWNTPPAEGDMFVNAEIDWGTYPPGQAVQFALSGNSPVAFSQIVALSVDNSRCGADLQFIFADSGFVLRVPAHAGGTFPVYTNALNFFVAAIGAGSSDATVLNVHNSMPPPIQLALSAQQNSVAVGGVPTTNGDTTLIAPPTSGTLNGASIVIDYAIGAASEPRNCHFDGWHGASICGTPGDTEASTGRCIRGAKPYALMAAVVRFR